MKHTYMVTEFRCDRRGGCNQKERVRSTAHREEVFSPDGWVRVGGLDFCSEDCADTLRPILQMLNPNYPVDRDGNCHGPVGNNARHPLDMD